MRNQVRNREFTGEPSDRAGRRARIVDVAAAAGVAPGTVSRVLNDDPTIRVRPETRRRIQDAAKAFDYSPNQAARALRKSRVGVFALAVHDVSNPVYQPIIRGAQRAASAQDVVLMISDAGELARGNAAFARTVRSGLIDGLLLLPAGDGSDRTVVELAANLVPMVIVNDHLPGLNGVSTDDAAAMSLMTQYIINLGHREVATLSLDGEGVRRDRRISGWRAALRINGIPAEPDWLQEGGHTVVSGREAMTRILASPRRPTAVVAASTLSAIGAIEAIHAAGLRVPADISVTGFHDVFFADYLTPGLTVVELPMEIVGEQSVDLLMKGLDGGEPEHRVLGDLKPVVIARGSTAPPPSAVHGGTR